MSRTLEQRRAAHALRMVKHLSSDVGSKYRSYADALPATIVMNGLGQAVATVISKGNPSKKDSATAAYDALYKHLQGWLCGDDPAAPYAEQGELIQAIVNNDQNTYLRAQAEALAYLVWVKKFARAYFVKGDQE